MSMRERAGRSSRFSFGNPPLLFARARLFSDRLELTGWHLRGRYRRQLLIRHMLQVDVLGKEGLLLWLASGETVRIRLQRAPEWKAAIDQQQAGV